MIIQKVEASETAVIARIIEIHDEMPRIWDPSHYVSKEYLSKVLTDITSCVDPQGFWILKCSSNHLDPAFDGMIWAKIAKSPLNGISICKINSFWIRPELRRSGLAPQLTEACLGWARAHNATRVECSTHHTNFRMREILGKQGFERGMVQYSLDI